MSYPPPNQYPPQGGFPPQGGYPPQQRPPQGYPPGPSGPSYGQPPPQQGNYPPQQGYGQPPPQQGGYPPAQGYGAPSQYPPSQGYAPSGPSYGQPPPQQGGWGASLYGAIPPQELQNLQAWFSSVDTDRSGSITCNELANYNLVGRPIGYETASKLIKIFDKQHSGTIEFFEFAALQQFLTKMQQAFFAADSDRSGTLDLREIFGALQVAGFQLTYPTLEALSKKFDNTGGRGLTFDQFLHVGAHLATVRSIFEWNDPSHSGRVTFTYDQLAHVTVHLLDNHVPPRPY
eukprot:TRINITY_DN3191_c0_g1_i1.p1 TRINITY_DN3191_c0_g1~~TRINITY_DN3191_c0_g1_i1.p1  ORF type:complete len:319 (+),score=93.62 TRINITY_DN3191_c0_g1_i1:94-957(+)